MVQFNPLNSKWHYLNTICPQNLNPQAPYFQEICKNCAMCVNFLGHRPSLVSYCCTGVLDTQYISSVCCSLCAQENTLYNTENTVFTINEQYHLIPAYYIYCYYNDRPAVCKSRIFEKLKFSLHNTSNSQINFIRVCIVVELIQQTKWFGYRDRLDVAKK